MLMESFRGGTAMRCPVCRVEMLTLEFAKIESDYCGECGGVWLDSGEIELLGERAGAMRKSLLAALDSEIVEREQSRKRHCPVCGMRRARVRPGGVGVSVDRCRYRHGLWFDRGELQAVIQAAGADASNDLIRFLADLEAQRRRRAEERAKEAASGA